MTLSKNQKKSINKKCSSFKGESKSKCIANAKRQYRESKADSKQHEKNIDKMVNEYEKELNKVRSDSTKYGKSVSKALSTIRFKKSKEGKKFASRGTEQRRDVKQQKFPYNK